MKKILALALCYLGLFPFWSCSTQPKMGFLFLKLTPMYTAFLPFEKVTVHIGNITGRNLRGDRVTLIELSRSLTLESTWMKGGDGVEAGIYTDIKLTIDSGEVIVNGIPHSLQIPNPEVDIPTDFPVKGQYNHTLTVEILVDKSILADGQGGYILKPVIRAGISSGKRPKIDS